MFFLYTIFWGLEQVERLTVGGRLDAGGRPNLVARLGCFVLLVRLALASNSGFWLRRQPLLPLLLLCGVGASNEARRTRRINRDTAGANLRGHLHTALTVGSCPF